MALALFAAAGATLPAALAGDVYDWKVMEAVGWQERDDQLYALASEVSRATGGK